jgi:hypothetical protein
MECIKSRSHLGKWQPAKAFEADETAAHALQFRVATAMGGPAWRANLYDQRLFKAL